MSRVPFPPRKITSPAATLCRRLVSLIVVCVSAPCCSDADDDTPPATTGPLYAVSVTSFSQGLDFASALILTVPSLTEGVADAKTGIEGAGELKIWPGARDGAAFAVIGEEAAIVRYELDSEGRLRATGKLGLSSLGITTFDNGEVIRVVSDHKAYFLSSAAWLGVEFDPSTLTITDSFDLGPLADTVPGYFAWNPNAERGSDLVGVAYYLDFREDITRPYSRAVFIDTETNALTFSETSCGGIGYLAWTDSGDLLGAPDPWSSTTDRLRAGPAPCMIRVKAGERKFDEGFSVPALDEPSSVYGGLIPGPDGSVYVRVLDESLVSLTEDSQVAEVYGARAWRTMQVSADFTRLEEVTSFPPTAGGLTWFEVEGKVWVNDSSEDFSSSSLVEMGANGPRPGLEVLGVPFGIVRMR